MFTGAMQVTDSISIQSLSSISKYVTENYVAGENTVGSLVRWFQICCCFAEPSVDDWHIRLMLMRNVYHSEHSPALALLFLSQLFFIHSSLLSLRCHVPVDWCWTVVVLSVWVWVSVWSKTGSGSSQNQCYIYQKLRKDLSYTPLMFVIIALVAKMPLKVTYVIKKTRTRCRHNHHLTLLMGAIQILPSRW